MPTAMKPAPTPEIAPRGLLSAKSSAILIVAASLTTLVVVFGLLHSPGDEPARMQSIPAQPNTVSQWVAAPAKPPVPTPPPPPPSVPAIDGMGFKDTSARCDDAERAVAIARTAKSAMVVCREVDGSYRYSGIRLRDGASLRLDDVRVIPAGFEAHNDGTTYRLSATELVVIAGETLQSRDPIVEYRAS
jgi:hypothetical protein